MNSVNPVYKTVVSYFLSVSLRLCGKQVVRAHLPQRRRGTQRYAEKKFQLRHKRWLTPLSLRRASEKFIKIQTHRPVVFACTSRPLIEGAGLFAMKQCPKCHHAFAYEL